MGVFRGSPLAPRVYVYQKVQYMAEVRPGHTSIPSVWNISIELTFDTEWYSDDAIVLAASEETLMAILSQQYAVVLRFKVRPVPWKQEYLHIRWILGAGATMARHHAKYGKAQRRAKRDSILVTGSQVLDEAAGTGLRRKVRAAMAEWATTTIHRAPIQGVARLFTEQVLAQVLARTQGAPPRAPAGSSCQRSWPGHSGTIPQQVQHPVRRSANPLPPSLHCCCPRHTA